MMELLHCSLRYFWTSSTPSCWTWVVPWLTCTVLGCSTATFPPTTFYWQTILLPRSATLACTVRLYDNMQSVVFTGTPAFMALETDIGDYTQSVDQFAYGCLIIHVLTHEWPSARDKQGTVFERREYVWMSSLKKRDTYFRLSDLA